jgi:hypothetical protein
MTGLGWAVPAGAGGLKSGEFTPETLSLADR